MQALILSSLLQLSADSTHTLTVPGYEPLGVVDYAPPANQLFVGSPSIVKLDSGDLVVSHDLFKSDGSQHGTTLFVSKDRGSTWESTALLPVHWGSLFVHQQSLYLLGVADGAEYNSVVIFRSDDGGGQWSEPVVLFQGKFHTAPTPIISHHGRIFRAVEEFWGNSWGQFDAFMISAPEDSDLLDSSKWTSTNRIRYESEWPGSSFLEGNALVDSNGAVVDVLRVHTTTGPEYAAILQTDEDTGTLSYRQHIPFNGGSKKFVVRFDERTQSYWSLTNMILDGDAINPQGGTERTRNRLGLVQSYDLIEWKTKATILYDADVEHSGFQYADWQFDGDDMIAAIRTSFNGASDSHNANYLTFLRINNFRQRVTQ